MEGRKERRKDRGKRERVKKENLRFISRIHTYFQIMIQYFQLWYNFQIKVQCHGTNKLVFTSE